MKTLISIVTLAGIVAVIGAVVVGVKSFDGTVTANPYEEGLEWDEARREKAELGWSVKMNTGILKMGDNDLQFTLLDKQSFTLDLPAKVSLTVSRPSTATHDRVFDVKKIKRDLYRASVNFPLYGYWDIKINILQNEKEIIFINRVFVDKG